MPQKPSPRRIALSAYLLFGAVLCYGVFRIGYDYADAYINERTYSEARSLYGITAEEAFQVTNNEALSTSFMDRSHHLKLLQDTINPDIVGWISIDNTRIDYPVVQAEDNEYYLHRNVLQRRSSAGSIFMDYRNDAVDLNQNTILYGHDMKDGSMFKDLILFEAAGFFEENRYVEFNAAGEAMRWEIFSVYSTSTDFYYIVPTFATELEYEAYLREIQRRSWHDREIELSTEDHILTLSTCSFDYDDGRLVVHARLIVEADQDESL